ncbi:MAG: helix-hairpin-helix domain-containing protein [Sphingobacteriales bacterium]|nr:helix-hairpin-helix domain-containing protein [Sphingobacteriales bacterium]
MKYFFIILFCFASLFVHAQTETTTTEQQLENQTEANESETEDDTYLQALSNLSKNPLNLNQADETDLKELRFLTPLQIQNFFRYRNIFGAFINIFELQAIPTWDVETIQKLLPYVTVKPVVNFAAESGKRFSGGTHSLLLRETYVLEKSRGFKQNDSANANSFYPGSRDKIFFRYKYVYKNLLQYGVVGEKDAGEQFFKGNQKQGFDFYSAHLFARNIGVIKALALGDFTVNMGQGLIQWQSLAFKKSPDALNVKRQATVLRPYNSAGEINFHRGVGITLQKNKWELTLFGSYKKLDANTVIDTSASYEEFISSFLTSGYHRTNSEVADKGSQKQLAFGGNLTYRANKWHVSANTIQYKFDLPIDKSDQPYNAFALSGNRWANYSADYSYTWRNLHFFGETALDYKNNHATVNGLLVSMDARADLALVYRNIAKGYQAINANAFTESTYPNNEKGLYAGVTLRPVAAIRIDAYADIYSFPFLKYQVDAPSSGRDYLVQLYYKPNKQVEVYTRYKTETKQDNYNPFNATLSPVPFVPKKNWRAQFSYKLNRAVTLRNRFEITWYDKKGPQSEEGFLTYFDVVYNPHMKPLSATVRLQYFETDGFNSRIYAYENDVLYSFSIPSFFDKGWRYYLNLNYSISKKLQGWLRIAQTMYKGKSLIGSGLDEIKGNHRTEAKVQFLYNF